MDPVTSPTTFCTVWTVPLTFFRGSEAPCTGARSEAASITARPCSRATSPPVNSLGASGCRICRGFRSAVIVATASREIGVTAPSALPETTTLCSSASRTVGFEGSRRALTSSAPWKRCTWVVVVWPLATWPGFTGSTSTTKTVPRTAAVAFGVRISMISPGRIRAFTTATPIFPDCRSTVTRPASSVTVSTDSSRTVMSALPPSSTRTSERSWVWMRSFTKISSRRRSDTGCAAATARNNLASPFTVVTTPALSSDCATASAGPAQISATATARVLMRNMIALAPLPPGH